MGTSTPFGGGNNKNPLIPSWLGGDGGAANPPALPDSADNPKKPEQPTASPANNRFRSARTHFNKYVRSDGSNSRSFGKAISSYISKTGGGSKTSARRMASERGAVGRLGSFLQQAGQAGLREALRSLNFNALANLTIPEIYASIVDVICEPGGDLDESFTRDAYLEAVSEIIELNLDDMERPSAETISMIMERFIANTIHDRILNAIGNELITLSTSVSAIRSIEKAFREFIRGAVSDAIHEANGIFTSENMNSTIENIYERSLSILQTHAEATAEESK